MLGSGAGGSERRQIASVYESTQRQYFLAGGLKVGTTWIIRPTKLNHSIFPRGQLVLLQMMTARRWSVVFLQIVVHRLIDHAHLPLVNSVDRAFICDVRESG